MVYQIPGSRLGRPLGERAVGPHHIAALKRRLKIRRYPGASCKEHNTADRLINSVHHVNGTLQRLAKRLVQGYARIIRAPGFYGNAHRLVDGHQSAIRKEHMAIDGRERRYHTATGPPSRAAETR